MRMPLHTRILLGAILGVVAGVIAHQLWGRAADTSAASRLYWFVDNITKPIGAIFLRMLMMMVAPLLFSALILGVSELGDLRRLGRIGVKTLIYTVVVSAIAVVIGR